jgi:hypothetical protein
MDLTNRGVDEHVAIQIRKVAPHLSAEEADALAARAAVDTTDWPHITVSVRLPPRGEHVRVSLARTELPKVETGLS